MKVVNTSEFITEVTDALGLDGSVLSTDIHIGVDGVIIRIERVPTQDELEKIGPLFTSLLEEYTLVKTHDHLSDSQS